MKYKKSLFWMLATVILGGSIVIRFELLKNKSDDIVSRSVHKEVMVAGVEDAGENTAEWTARDLREPSYVGSSIKVAVIDELGKPKRNVRIEMWRRNEAGRIINVLGFNTFDKESVIFPLVKKDGEKIECDITEWVFEDAEYTWRYADVGNPNVVTEMSAEYLCKTPKLGEKNTDFILALKPGLVRKVIPSLFVEGTLPIAVPKDEFVEVYYMIAGKPLMLRLAPGDKRFRMEFPSYGGELMVGGTAKSIALVHMEKVEDSKIPESAQRRYDKSNKCKLLVNPEPEDTMIDFLPTQTARLGLSWTRVSAGTDSSEVYIEPGTYWVRRAVTGRDRDYTVAPYTKVLIDSTENVIDLRQSK